MAASPSIFLLFMVLLAGIALATSYGVHGSAGFGFEAGVANEHQSKNNNDGHSESRFSFPSAAGIDFLGGNRTNSEADANEHQIGPNKQSHEHHYHNQHNQNSYNDTEGERKFRWPSSVGITFTRSNVQNPETGVVADSLTGPNRLSHEDPQYHHTRSAYSGDTDDERKFRWPSTFGLTITRSNEQKPELGAAADSLTGPNRLSHEDPQYIHTRSAYSSDTDDERKFRWPSTFGLTITRSNEQKPELGAAADSLTGPNRLSHEDPQYIHTRSAYNSDTDDERKFRWPSTFGFTISRSNEQKPELGAGTDYFEGQSGPNYDHHHHHNHSAHNNNTDGERKFRWPSSVGITITRSNKPNSDEDEEAKFFGLIPSIVSCNHTQQAGRSCSDCTHTLLCFANDIGIQRNCSPLYCNQGRCAVEPSGECSPAT